MWLLFDNAVMEVLARIARSFSRPLRGLSVDGADILMICLASQKDECEYSGRKFLYPEHIVKQLSFWGLVPQDL